MLTDHTVPSGCEPLSTEPASPDRPWDSARWTPNGIARLVAHLASDGAKALREAAGDDLLAAWEATVEELLDPHSTARQALDPAWSVTTGLSPPALRAAVEAVLGGVRGEPARRLWAEAGSPRELGPVAVVLAANLPALAVQPLLPALALRRPVLLKSPSAEPLFAAVFTGRLGTRHAALREAVAAVTWRGGDQMLEQTAYQGCSRILAYGADETLRELVRRAGNRLVPYGPKISLAVLGADVDPVSVAPGLARDIALFDQRGCLSIHAVFTGAAPEAVAQELAEELQRLRHAWPPGPASPAELAAVQQVRLEAALRGLFAPELPPYAGTVIVETRARFDPSPGLRTVRVHPLAEPTRLVELLAPWEGRLQGAALAGDDAWALAAPLERLGVSRLAAPGELQSPDALWHNGGRHPLAALGD